MILIAVKVIFTIKMKTIQSTLSNHLVNFIDAAERDLR